MEINGTTYKFVSLLIQYDGVTPALVEILFATDNGASKETKSVKLFNNDAIAFFISRPTPRNLYEKLCDDLGVSYDLIPENF